MSSNNDGELAVHANGSAPAASHAPKPVHVRLFAPSELDEIRGFYNAYSDMIMSMFQIDLEFQNFKSETANLPYTYVPSTGGALFVAARDRTTENGGQDAGQELLGTCAIRKITTGPLVEQAQAVQPDADKPAVVESVCEVKRLYVDPKARGLGVGKLLLEACLDEAKAQGYTTIVLDTLPGLKSAVKLYGSLGFERTADYNGNPQKDVMFFAKKIN